MKTVKALLELARKAISDGDLELGKSYTAQAKAMKDIAELEESEVSAEKSALDLEVIELREFKAQIEAAPPARKSFQVDVIEDETDKKAVMPWLSLGDQLKAVYTAAVHPHRIDERLKAQKAVLGMSEGIPSDGGYLVQNDFATEIFRLAHDGGQILSRIRRIPISANANGLTMNAIDETSRVTGSRWGGVQAYWASEGDAVSSSKPKMRQITLGLNKLFAIMYATDEMLADTTALGAIANEAVSEEIIWHVENSILRGTGAGQPKGIIGDTATVSVAKEVGQATATLVYQNLYKMWSRMWGRSRMNAIWLHNQDIEPILFAMTFPVGTGGLPLYLPPGGIAVSPLAGLLGRPMIPVEQASTVGTVGDIMLFDPSQYLLIDKGGITSAESMHVQFLTDQMTFRWTYRVDGQLAWRSALTPANGTNTLSPVVTLDTRS